MIAPPANIVASIDQSRQWFTYRVLADFYEEQGEAAVARCFRELKTLLKLQLCLKVITKLTTGRPSITVLELASDNDLLCGYTTVRSVLEGMRARGALGRRNSVSGQWFYALKVDGDEIYARRLLRASRRREVAQVRRSSDHGG